ncbi:MAG: hypothetical protein E7386_11420, partial [Ruminococcaceae bacterium]|nr:hypothetical protein [Oscillospiraceae bacterium]
MPLDPDELNNKNKGNGKNKPLNDKDDFVGSSFAVQFKPGDTANSVSDKLKEGNQPHDDFDAFKDEFDDFVFDESITAFKPADNAESMKSAFTPKGGAQPEARPAHVNPAVRPAQASAPAPAPEKKQNSGIPAFPKNGGTFDRKPSDDVSKGPDKSNTPVFGSDDKGKVKPVSPAQKKDEKLFTSGNNLDYATSEHDKDKSPFANAKRPDMPTPDEVDVPRAEKKPEVKTYGTVSSGVNAFGSAKNQDKHDKAKEEGAASSPFVIRPTPSPKPAAPKAPEAKAPEANAHEAKAHQAPKAPKAEAPKAEPAKSAPAAHVPPAAAKQAQNDKSKAPAGAPAAHTPPAAAKAAPEAHTPPVASKSAPEAHKPPKAPQAEASAPDNNKPVGQRPGEAAKQKAPTLSRPAPTGAAIDSIRPE